MKSNAPWSVKGIERDARETAKEAARREGMTVGEWLNQAIYAVGAPEGASGPIAGLKAADIVAAVEHLKKRIVAAESKSAAAVDDLARNLAGVVERLQRLERLRPVEGGASPALEERLARLEEKAFDRQRIDALKALEKAVAQAALQFDAAHKSSQARIEAAEKRLDDLARKMETAGAGDALAAIAPLKEALEGMSARIARAERIAAEAAQLKAEAAGAGDSDFVERTGARLRALGDEIKRGGNQIRTLEAAIRKLSDHIDAAERRSAEAVQKVSETVETLRDRLERPAAGDDAKIASLQVAVEALAARIEAAPRAETGRREETEPDADIEAELVDIDEAGEDAALFDDAAEPLELSIEDDDEIGVAPEGETDGVYRRPPQQKLQSDEAADDEDAFAFDLDDDAGEDHGGKSVEEYAAAMLSDTDDARGRPEPDEAEATAGEDDDALDAAFAAFEAEKRAERARLRETTDGALFAANRDAPQAAQADGDKKDDPAADEPLLKADPRSAALRRLSPKQRAALAAKLRRRRLVRQGLSLDDAAPEAKPRVEPAEARTQKYMPSLDAPENDDEAREDDREPGMFSRMTGALGAMKRRLVAGQRGGADDRTARLAARATDRPRASSTFAAEDEDQLAHEDDAPRSSEPDISGGLRRLAAQAAARPVPVALAAAIVLAGAALFFLVKDSILGGSAGGPEEARSQAAADGDEAAALAPAIDPRALYRESAARLKNARNDADTREALKGLEQAAALGHPPAQLQLGELYKLGQGAPQDLAAARAWYERAANGGNVLAMHRAGVMAARGQGGPADPEAAIAWFEKAAGFGLVDSQYNLGALYHPGGNEANAPYQDAAKAYFWYALAARNGDEQARALADGLASGLPAEQRRALDQSVAAWTPQTPDPEANEPAPAS
ncbi:tetratricopeptide repeat protein [Amphiplicatus metriothermophilus]|uniref:TPR repeat n=1 Tax=Amphiplicatus metriothermophilus TaxID=1519374 RepID=A0A239PZ30_9PROT|nr:tetratricopeptide repeat protein [Amphiplicatus metriothermophilus]MBB5518279.1 localization factor PodJL [Amphiplicatus metriothermophilus]SNT75524.1 TPR repeat [Amphiplicatus metriothermophilus]